MAWLHAVPEGSKKSRLASYREQDEDSPFLKLPDIDETAEYLINLWQEAGLVSTSGTGIIPLTWVDINAWLSVTELTLPVHDKLVIKQLSEAYAAEYNAASDKDRPAPYLYADELIKQRTKVNDRLKEMMRNLQAGRKK